MKLHIGNIAKNITEPELKVMITPFAEATSIEIVKDTMGVSKGYGFAVFTDDAHGKAVIAGLDGKEFSGSTLKVAEARPRKGDAPQPARVPQI